MAGLEDHGCRVFYKNFFKCRPCEGADHSGYWDPDDGVRQASAIALLSLPS